jgi:hypothetical protein
MRATTARATELLDELERREEMAAALRARAIEETKRALSGEARAPVDAAPGAASPTGPAPRAKSGSVAVPDDRGSLDEIEIDLAD